MKKLLMVLAVLTLALVLTGCNKESQEELDCESQDGYVYINDICYETKEHYEEMVLLENSQKTQDELNCEKVDGYVWSDTYSSCLETREHYDNRD